MQMLASLLYRAWRKRSVCSFNWSRSVWVRRFCLWSSLVLRAMSNRPDLLRILYVLQKRFLLTSALLSLGSGCTSVFSWLPPQGAGRLSLLVTELRVNDKELVNSGSLTGDEGFSLTEAAPAPGSAGWKEIRLCGAVLGLEGTAGAGELELLPPPLLFCCLSLWQDWLPPCSDPDEEDDVEEAEDAVPLPEELEPSPGCGAILG